MYFLNPKSLLQTINFTGCFISDNCFYHLLWISELLEQSTRQQTCVSWTQGLPTPGAGEGCVERQSSTLWKASQDDLIGRDPILHLMLNQGLDVLCCFLDASLILWRIWIQPHQAKPGVHEGRCTWGEGARRWRGRQPSCAVSSSPFKKITSAVSCSAPDTVAVLVSGGTDMVLPHIHCRAPRLGPPLPGGFKTSREIFLFLQHRHMLFPRRLTLPGPKLF